MRERVEDLGRIAVMIETLVDNILFTGDHRPPRPKEAIDWFRELKETEQDDYLHNTSYQIESVRNDLYEVLLIAKGQDYLNGGE